LVPDLQEQSLRYDENCICLCGMLVLVHASFKLSGVLRCSTCSLQVAEIRSLEAAAAAMQHCGLAAAQQQ
jgi:hypothetical protein